MQVPLHPAVVHLPLVTALLLPFLVLAFSLMIRANKMPAKAWLLIVGLQLFTTGTGYLALETGETEEDTVEKVVEHRLIHDHEEASEIFVGSTVLALVLGVVAFFIRKEFQFHLHMAVLGAMVISAFLGYRAGTLGGELVYVHGAASAYTDASQAPAGLLPTPGKNTSESPYPVEENESLKLDEHDYGNSDEVPEDEEGLKQED